MDLLSLLFSAHERRAAALGIGDSMDREDSFCSCGTCFYSWNDLFLQACFYSYQDSMVQVRYPNHSIAADNRVCARDCDKKILAMEYSSALFCNVYYCNKTVAPP